MLTTLLRHLRGLPLLVLTLLCFSGIHKAQASHLLGGEITYRYLGAVGTGTNPFRYEVTVFLYINGNASQQLNTGRATLDLGFYQKNGTIIRNLSVVNNGTFNTGNGVLTVNKTSYRSATPRVPNCAGVAPAAPVNLARYTTTVDLPVSLDGYYVYYTEGARNDGITNIFQNGQTGSSSGNLTLYAEVAPPLLPNSAPTFSDTAVAVICQGDTVIIVNNATDADGDRLTYSYGTPYAGTNASPPFTFTPPPTSIVYAAGYSLAQPFGATPGSLISLNANTGLSTYSIQNAGTYTVAVDVNEYRNINGVEVLIGSVRRDVQLITRQCPAGARPVISAILPRSYTIEEGQPLTFPITATTSPATIPLRVRVISSLLDGAGRYNTTFDNDAGTVATGQNTGTVTIQNNGTTTGNFVFNSQCGDARATPYDILVSATPIDCKSTTTSDVFRVTVTKAAAPTGITGPLQICDPATIRTYTAAGPASPTYTWRVTGGTITGGQGTSAVQVRWNSATATGRLSLKGVSAYGCNTDSVTQNIDIRPLAALAVTPSAPSICRGASTTLTVTGATGLTYTWTGGTTTTTGSSITVSPTATTVYTVTGSDGACSTSSQVTVTVTPAPTVSPNPTAAFCSGATANLGGVTPVAGTTYLWSPTTGLSNPTSATPTITLTNTTGAPITTTYTLTATTAAGCTATANVAVTVNPRPVANAGVDAAQCGTITQVLGTPTIAGNTYSWSPTTGLSNPNIAQPTVTLTNPSSSASLVTTYTLTVLSAVGCAAADAVTVTVFPGTVTPTPTQSLCSGATITLGGVTPVAGTTYLWSPTTGLSDPTSPTPTITLTNTTGAPITTTYTLTATTNATLGTCTATATVAVTVIPLPVANAGPAITTCSNVASAPLGQPAISGYTYSWSPATGLSSTTAAQPTVTLPNTTGAAITQTYTLTVTGPSLVPGGPSGCTATSTVTVTINPGAVANPDPTAAFCSGASAVLGGVTAVAGTTYSWTPTTGLSNPSIANPTVTGTNTTSAPVTTTYTLTATTAQGCTTTGTVAVTINPLPVATAGADRSQCGDISTPLGAAPVAGTTYSWTPTTGLSNPSIANPVLTLSNTGTTTLGTTYTLTATTAAGCSATSSVTITLFPAAVATPGPAVSFCSGGSAQLGVPPVAGTTYSWTPTTGLSDATAANPTVTGTNTTGAPITTTYTLTTTTTDNCTATGTVAVTINPAAVALPGADRTVCSNLGTALGAAPVAGNTYSWTPTTGLSNPSIANPVATLNNSTSATITQTYTLTTTTAQGCSATGTVTVTVYPATVADAGPDLTVCSGASGLVGTPALPGYTYLWLTTPQSGITLDNVNIAQPTFTAVNPSQASFFRILVLQVTDANGCTAQDQVQITINPAAVAEAGPDRTSCSGLSAQLGVAPAANTFYSWSPVTGLSDPSVANPTITLTNTTGAPITQRYYLTATTSAGCTALDSVTVTVNPGAGAVAGADVAFCSGASAQLGGAALAGTTYSWSPATDLSSATAANPTVTSANLTGAPVTTTYVLTATTALGCTATDTVAVTVNPAAVATPGAAVSFCSGGSAQLGGTAIAGTTYSWSPATGLSDATTATPTVTLTNTTTAAIATTYTLTATTANGCVATATVVVTVTPAAVVDAGASQTVCADQRLTLGTPTLPGYSYTWTPATGLSSASAAQPVLNTTGLNTTTAPLSLTYYLSAATADGCAGRDSVTVTINPRPAPEGIVGSASVCPTVTGVAYSVVNPAGTSYQWIITGGTQASGGTTGAITVDWGAAGTGLVQVYSLNSFGCASDTSALPVTINQVLQTPTPTGPGDVTAAAPNNAVCQADGPFLYATRPYTNGSIYAWTIIGGTQVSTSLNTVTVNWNPVTVPTIGKLIVTETSNPSSGVRCLGTSDTLRVLINPSPLGTLALSGPARVCQGNSISFSLPGGFAGSTYAFVVDNQPVTSTGNSVSLPVQTTPGTYVVGVRETSAQGCAGPLITTTFIVDPTPVAATITGPTFVCDISQPLPYSVANTTGSIYQWTVVGGRVVTGDSTSQVTVQFTAGLTTYSVSVVEISGFGCAGPGASLTVLPDAPSLTLALASVATTSNNSVVLTLAVPGGTNTPNAVQVLRRVAGSGSFTAIGTVPASATTYTDATADAAANSYEYQLELTNGCGTTVQSAIAQTIRLQATATVGTGGRNQGSTALTWNAYVGFPVAEYRIYRANDAGQFELVSPSVSATTLTATVDNGTAGSATGSGFNQQFRVVAVSTGATPLLSNSNTTSVDFANAVATYNIITPNNDGKNDVLVFDNITLYPGNSLTIFSRWGREVYNTTNYQNNWGGADSPAGTYYYLLKLPNGTTRKSWFEIVK